MCALGQNYSYYTIPEELKKNTDAVIRLENTLIEIQDQENMLITYQKVITVLNDNGDNDVESYLYYRPSMKIKSLEAQILDINGDIVEKIKEKDFIDRSIVDGFYSESRLKYYQHTAITYPYTIVLTYSYKSSLTAFLANWTPIEGYYLSTEKNIFEIHAPPELGLHIKETNLNNFQYTKTELADGYKYTATNIAAIKPETYSPPTNTLFPKVRFALKKFHLEGENGEATDWKKFGKWMYDDLLVDTYDLPEATKSKIKRLVENKTSTYEKAKAVYEYMQQNTRYISIQVGIGGWKPMKASEVDALGYGDCKALTNYTKNLMDAAGVTSYYTVVSAGKEKVNIEKDFTAMQGNHIILQIPTEDKNVWVDCTSQIHPFDFIGDFTDDRDVLVIKPDGGEIVHTATYLNDDNLQLTNATCSIDENGKLIGSVTVKTYGTQYDNRFYITNKTSKELDKYYKNYWDNINNLTIENYKHTNNKDKIEFVEEVKLNANNYMNFSGEIGLISPNIFNKISSTPDRYKSRNTPLYIERGFMDKDLFEIKLPASLKADSLPETITIDNDFGHYSISVEIKENTIVYKREFGLKAGTYAKEKYSEFRKFLRTVSKTDDIKIIIKKTT